MIESALFFIASALWAKVTDAEDPNMAIVITFCLLFIASFIFTRVLIKCLS